MDLVNTEEELDMVDKNMVAVAVAAYSDLLVIKVDLEVMVVLEMYVVDMGAMVDMEAMEANMDQNDNEKNKKSTWQTKQNELFHVYFMYELFHVSDTNSVYFN